MRSVSGSATWGLAFAVTVSLWASCALAQGPAGANARPKARTYTCPIDGGQTLAIGHDGKQSPKRYSDFEVPTRAYTNLVVACPKCGYANWTHDFERPVPGEVTGLVHSRLKTTAKLASVNPVVAYEHHMMLLHQRGAQIREQIGTGLFYVYVLKRHRPWGGMDTVLERKILAARERVLKMLEQAMRTDPPRTERGRTEWQYLIGELQRLTGKAKLAVPTLKAVCAQPDVGYTVRKLACEMADRAGRGDTSEDYRDGQFDAQGIEAAEKRAAARREAKKVEEAQPRPPENKPDEKASEPEQKPDPEPSNLPMPPTAAGDKYAPPPPPPAK